MAISFRYWVVAKVENGGCPGIEPGRAIIRFTPCDHSHKSFGLELKPDRQNEEGGCPGIEPGRAIIRITPCDHSHKSFGLEIQT
jgi:hypothetical protein